ncbi:DUF2381 family protein [Archangium lansingense]|uniref:DUF2381 family protein n=1 Tax=Archangium lansingense TaxID=2995310 RepID=A0ABT4A9F6_9BACT|nr:DUF2381 family protein [Archangium lansinium]MCY1078288.1 DUF2381 family protein [Archangium lansinium]
MLPPHPLSLIVLVHLQGSPLATPAPSPTVCADNQRVELSLAPTVAVPEVCVSPGLLSGFTFDAPAVVELQDEVRFAEVMRGRSGISFVPPPDMVPGEHLRLTARWGEGSFEQSVTFSLVAHSGRATHQVEVYRDKRSRESIQHELAQERAKNQQLHEENERIREEYQQLRTRLERAGRLQGLYASGALGEDGVKATPLAVPMGQQPGVGALLMTRGVSYRSEKTVAVEFLLMNAGTDSWLATGASIETATGERLEGVTLWQEEAIAPAGSRRVFVEAEAGPGMPRGDVTVRLWDESGRTISIPKVTFP